jgi:hypothetical protein
MPFLNRQKKTTDNDYKNGYLKRGFATIENEEK